MDTLNLSEGYRDVNALRRPRSLSDWWILIAQGGTWAIKISINQAPLGVCKVKIAACRNFFDLNRTSPTNS